MCVALLRRLRADRDMVRAHSHNHHLALMVAAPPLTADFHPHIHSAYLAGRSMFPCDRGINPFGLDTLEYFAWLAGWQREFDAMKCRIERHTTP